MCRQKDKVTGNSLGQLYAALELLSLQAGVLDLAVWPERGGVHSQGSVELSKSISVLSENTVLQLTAGKKQAWQIITAFKSPVPPFLSKRTSG